MISGARRPGVVGVPDIARRALIESALDEITSLFGAS